MKVLAAAVLSSLATAWFLTGQASAPRLMKIDNRRVRVSEWVYTPGEPRTPYIRPTDQIIVFLDDARYERKDSKTGAIEIRERKSGEVLWHGQGEDAPQLTAIGKACRTIVIELKQAN
jgi:hypothetical protein